MWILDNEIWPPAAFSTQDPSEYRLHPGEDTPPIPVRLGSSAAPGWTVRLSEICLWDIVTQRFILQEKLDDFVTLDNGENFHAIQVIRTQFSHRQRDDNTPASGLCMDYRP